jgi:alpha-1,3-mannosyltransferase
MMDEISRTTSPAEDGRSGPIEHSRAAATGPLRVVHVVRRYAPLIGGTETYVRDLAEAQASRGHRVTVVTLDHDVTGVFRGRLPALEEARGVRIVRLPGLGARRFALTSRPWRLIHEVSEANIVHVHDIRFMTGTICLTARLRGRRTVVHTHGLIFHTPWAARLKRFLVRAYYGPILKVSGASIVASSRPDGDALMELAPYLSRRLVVYENAIRLGGLLALPRDPVPGRVLAFGRISPTKALDRLLSAIALIPRERWELWIAGPEEPAERARLEALAVSLGITPRITWRGTYSNDEFGRLLGGAEVAAFPSPGEGFGLALLEAMAAGVPVLANDIPAHRALLGERLAANLVDFASPERAAAATARLLDLGAEAAVELGRMERSRAEAFDISRLVREIDELYESLGVRS